MMEFAVEVKNVTKKYDRFTLSDVSFSVPQGCIMGLIGENGASNGILAMAQAEMDWQIRK